VEDVRVGHGQLSEQMSPDSRLGRSLHPSQGTHQQRYRHEVISVLQGLPCHVLSYSFCRYAEVCYEIKLEYEVLSTCTLTLACSWAVHLITP